VQQTANSRQQGSKAAKMSKSQQKQHLHLHRHTHHHPPALKATQTQTHRFSQTLSQIKRFSYNHSPGLSLSLHLSLIGPKRQLFGALLAMFTLAALASTTNGKSYMHYTARNWKKDLKNRNLSLVVPTHLGNISYFDQDRSRLVSSLLFLTFFISKEELKA